VVPRRYRYPDLSPDGTRVAFTSTRAGGFDIWVMDLDPAGLRREVDAANASPDRR
jgi:Tol biopolymer transport system component